VVFLVFVISPNGRSMEWDLISMVEDLLTPESIRDMQVLFGFTNS
jgi:hypothetical protein